jgi:hypothetical protein
MKKIDYEITVDVRGLSASEKMEVQDAYFELGYGWMFGGEYHWGLGESEHKVYTNTFYSKEPTKYLTARCSDMNTTHTLKQLMELADMDDPIPALQDLNSDELRTKLTNRSNTMSKYDELKTVAGQMSDRIAALEVVIYNLATTKGEVAALAGGTKGALRVELREENIHRYFILRSASGGPFGSLNVTEQMTDALLPVLCAERDQLDNELAAIRAKLGAVEELLS